MSSASETAPKDWMRLATPQALDLVGKLLRDVQEVELSVDDDLNVVLRPAAVGKEGTGGFPEERETLVLLPETSEVQVGGQTVASLTAKEFALLSHLRSRQGTICSKEAICQVLWPDRSPSQCDSGLDNLVSRVRAKIEPRPAKPRFLITVRGQGYRLVAN